MKRTNLIVIGKKIRELRKAQGYSQENFAYDAGLERSYLGKVERGERNIQIESLIKIAFGLRMELGDILPKLRQLKKTVK